MVGRGWGGGVEENMEEFLRGVDMKAKGLML